MKKLLSLILALMLSLTAVSALADKFIQGIDPEYPPFSYLDDNGEYTGFDVEICKAACDLLGLEHEIFTVDWDNKLIQMDNMECDCVWSGMTIRETMYKQGYTISTPYYYNTQVLVVKKDSGITSSKDLAGKYVAVQLGTSGEALLNEELTELKDSFAELVTCQSFLVCFTELEGGAVDAVFVDLPVAAAYVATHEALTVIDESLGAEEYGIAFRPADKELCEKIDGAVAQLVENGTYAEIAAKYPDIVENLIFLQAK